MNPVPTEAFGIHQGNACRTPMRECHVLPRSPTVLLIKAGIWGGAETHAIRLAEALVRRGRPTTLLALDARTYELFAGRVQHSVVLAQIELRRPVEMRSFVDWWRGFGPWSGSACVYEKGTLHSGSLGLEAAARLRFRRFLTIEHLEPPPLPPRTSRRHLGGLLPGVGLWWYRMVVRGYLRLPVPRADRRGQRRGPVPVAGELPLPPLQGGHRP